MNKPLHYRQCLLRRKNVEQTSWIPEAFAVVGMVLKLRQRGKAWVNGWVVIEVGAKRIGEDTASMYEQQARDYWPELLIG